MLSGEISHINNHYFPCHNCRRADYMLQDITHTICIRVREVGYKTIVENH